MLADYAYRQDHRQLIFIVQEHGMHIENNRMLYLVEFDYFITRRNMQISRRYRHTFWK
jgi:hypothetical protein